MNHGSIISDAEALKILKNDLRKVALEKHASDLSSATSERRAEIIAQIEGEIEQEIRQRATRNCRAFFLH